MFSDQQHTVPFRVVLFAFITTIILLPVTLLAKPALYEVTVTTIPDVYEATGTVRPLLEADIMAQASGQFLATKAVEGQTVTSGTALATIEDRQLKLSLSQALSGVTAAQAGKRQAEQSQIGALALLNQAKLELDRVKKMHSGNAATNQQLEQAQASYAQAQAAAKGAAEAVKGAQASINRANAAVEEVQVSLGYTEVTAPFTGVISKKYIHAGDLAWPGRPVYRIINSDKMRIEANVRESLAGRLKQGQKLEARIDATELTTHGTITEISPSEKALSRTFNIKVELEETTNLLSGMFARVLIPLENKSCITIPSTYITRIGQLEMVHIKNNETISRQLIRTGRKIGDTVVITSGIKAGDILVAPEGNKQ